jgi:hypothetical protein
MAFLPSVRNILPTGIDHGTVTVLFNDGSAYEVTTLRRDVATDGRHALVEFTSDWEADAARRDFTINAMMADTDGNLYDWFGGEADLRAGIVRFVGDAKVRLQEDYLRALRYYRFHARFGQEARHDPATTCALAEVSENLGTLSAERVWSEFCKLVAVEDKAKVADAMRLMFTSMNAVDSGLFEHDQAYAYAWGYAIAVLPRIVKEYTTPAVIWAMMAREASVNGQVADMVAAASLRLKWSGDERKQALYTITTYRGSNIGYAAEYDYLVGGMPREWVDEAYGCTLKSRGQYPVFPVNGHDIMAAVPGIKGPDIGSTLRAMKHVWFNDRYATTKEQLLKMRTT